MQFSNATLSTNDTFVTNEMSQIDTQSFKLKGKGEENRSIYADLCMTSLDKGSLEINFYTMAQVGFNIEQPSNSMLTSGHSEKFIGGSHIRVIHLVSSWHTLE